MKECRKARIVIQMPKCEEVAKVLTDEDTLAAKFMVRLLDTLLRIVSVQCLGLFSV